MSRPTHKITSEGLIYINSEGPCSEPDARRFAWGLLADLGDDDAAAILDGEETAQVERYKRFFDLPNPAPALLLLKMLSGEGRLFTNESARLAIGSNAQGDQITPVYLSRIRTGLAARGFFGVIRNAYSKGWWIDPKDARKIMEAVDAER